MISHGARHRLDNEGRVIAGRDVTERPRERPAYRAAAGVEVLKAIKQLDDSIAVIMVTANEQVALAAEALKSGAFGYVPKPFDFRFLDHTLTAILNRPTSDDNTAHGKGSV